MEPRPAAARLVRAVQELHPAYAGLVMATGICSTGLAVLHHRWLSEPLLVIAILVFAVLLVGYGWRLVRFPRRVVDDLRDPSRTFGYFTLVAAANVLSVRMALDQHLTTAAGFAIASVPVWFVLSYLVPLAIAAKPTGAVMTGINGSWYLWAVGTQSIAEASATLGSAIPSRAHVLGTVAVVFWSIGLMLYLIIAVLVVARLLVTGLTPQMSLPSYWISMGATAISVLAAAKIVALPGHVPALAATREVVSGVGFVLWAFGSWWIPMLIVLGIWRHFVRRLPFTYDPSWWSLVFPLGMYTVACVRYGQVAGLRFLTDIAAYSIWAAVAALIAVCVLVARRLVGNTGV